MRISIESQIYLHQKEFVEIRLYVDDIYDKRHEIVEVVPKEVYQMLGAENYILDKMFDVLKRKITQGQLSR